MKTNHTKKILFIALSVLLILSISLNYVLYRQLRHYYTLLYAVELDPLGLSYFQNNDPLPSDGQPIVVFFGDSHAAQWPNPSLSDYEFVNRGIGNQTSAQVASRFDVHVKSLQPDIVILQVGINDLKTIPLFPKKRSEIISDCEANIQKIVDQSTASGSLIILTTIFPTGKVSLERKLVWSDDIGKAIAEVNHYILNISHEKVVIFDAAKLLSDSNREMKQEFEWDELHINQQGYEALNLELIKILQALE